MTACKGTVCEKAPPFPVDGGTLRWFIALLHTLLTDPRLLFPCVLFLSEVPHHILIGEDELFQMSNWTDMRTVRRYGNMVQSVEPTG